MSWLNPIEDLKLTAKDVHGLAASMEQAGRKLFQDAAATEKEISTAAARVAGSAAQSARAAGRDLAGGHLAAAARDAGKGIWHADKQAAKTMIKVTGDVARTVGDQGKGAWQSVKELNKIVIDGSNAAIPGQGESLALAEVFGESAINTAIFKPLDGLSQLASWGVKETTGYKLPSLQLCITPDTTGLGVAGKVAEFTGSAVGFAAPVLLTGGLTTVLGIGAEATEGVAAAADAGEAAETACATSRVGEFLSAAKAIVSKGTTWKPLLDGAISGFLFTPSSGKGSFLSQRMEAAAVNGITFGAQAWTANAFDSAAKQFIGKVLEERGGQFAENLLANGVGGLAGGAANAEASALTEEHRVASVKELLSASGQFGLVGLAMELIPGMLRFNGANVESLKDGRVSTTTGSRPREFVVVDGKDSLEAFRKSESKGAPLTVREILGKAAGDKDALGPEKKLFVQHFAKGAVVDQEEASSANIMAFCHPEEAEPAVRAKHLFAAQEGPVWLAMDKEAGKLLFSVGERPAPASKEYLDVPPLRLEPAAAVAPPDAVKSKTVDRPLPNGGAHLPAHRRWEILMDRTPAESRELFGIKMQHAATIALQDILLEKCKGRLIFIPTDVYGIEDRKGVDGYLVAPEKNLCWPIDFSFNDKGGISRVVKLQNKWFRKGANNGQEWEFNATAKNEQEFLSEIIEIANDRKNALPWNSGNPLRLFP